ncbi:hypothetical protein F8A87_09755 [Betaproteobacteria bacterium SCN2]|jgi:hypothetical protein|nr:hypothetical protein F8A87_09755 [Betaproteobacteria bacterium SCN2]
MTASAKVQCAIVRPIGSTHSHNTAESSPELRALPAPPSLKALAGAVLDRTLPRTLSAQSAQSPHTLGALWAGDPHKSELTELAVLVRQCGEAYGFTEQEHVEALTAALANPVEALTCFRTMVCELDRLIQIDDMAGNVGLD